MVIFYVDSVLHVNYKTLSTFRRDKIIYVHNLDNGTLGKKVILSSCKSWYSWFRGSGEEGQEVDNGIT